MTRRLALAALVAAGGTACGSQGQAGSAARPPVDGGVADAPSAPTAFDGGSEAEATTASRCMIAAPNVTCEHQSQLVSDSITQRTVAYETPLGEPPPGGWPAVIYFQGSFVPGHTAFAAAESAPFGVYQLTLTIKALLDGGYAVLAPDASSNGSQFWETNIPPWAETWSGCPDDVLMGNLFGSLSQGGFGPIDTSRLYAMGISSGGFMTSRMAVSYRGRFRALADHSGSYATCSAACSVPTPLPADHPPTLFLHGDNDAVVPMSSLQPYMDALAAEGHEVKLVTDSDAGHEWLPAGPSAIRGWFDAH